MFGVSDSKGWARCIRHRVRSKMMTVAAIMGGLLPIMWTTGTGADVMKRIAAPMVGGMVSSTILTLIVIPVLYSMWRHVQLGSTMASPRFLGIFRVLWIKHGM